MLIWKRFRELSFFSFLLFSLSSFLLFFLLFFLPSLFPSPLLSFSSSGVLFNRYVSWFKEEEATYPRSHCSFLATWNCADSPDSQAAIKKRVWVISWSTLLSKANNCTCCCRQSETNAVAQPGLWFGKVIPELAGKFWLESGWWVKKQWWFSRQDLRNAIEKGWEKLDADTMRKIA